MRAAEPSDPPCVLCRAHRYAGAVRSDAAANVLLVQASVRARLVDSLPNPHFIAQTHLLVGKCYRSARVVCVCVCVLVLWCSIYMVPSRSVSE